MDLIIQTKLALASFRKITSVINCYYYSIHIYVFPSAPAH